METKAKYVAVAGTSVIVTIIALAIIGVSMESRVVINDERLPLQSDENIIVDELDTVTESKVPTLIIKKRPLTPSAEYLRDKNNRSVFSVDWVVTAGDTQFYASTLELRIHELTNIEREKHGFEPLLYDKVLAVTARHHSIDMAERDYFAHTAPEGSEPMDRGFAFGYYDCGDPDTIQLSKKYDKLAAEYDLLLTRYESGGSSDYVMYDKLDQMYNTLEQMRIELNQLSIKKPIFEGIGENILQNSLYEQAWYLEGEIVSYDWYSYEEIAESTVDGWMKSPNHKENILTPSWQSEGIGISATDYKVYITQNFC
jgi:uncharacterized protein YkwD